MTIQENPSEDIAVQPFLTTSDSAFLVDPVTQEKTQGAYVLGAVATETVNAVSYTHLDVYKRQVQVKPEGITMPPNTLDWSALTASVRLCPVPQSDKR